MIQEVTLAQLLIAGVLSVALVYIFSLPMEVEPAKEDENGD